MSVIAIRGLAELRNRLARIDASAAARHAALAAAAALADAVRVELSVPPGGPHAHPWRRGGELLNSIDFAADVDSVVIGSTSAVAADQELGTQTVPPRPFLAPAAARGGAEAAAAIGAAVAQTLEDR